MIANPWTRAAEAERRAAVSEDRAGFLEQELHWMRGQLEAANAAKDAANKIVANVFGQFHGFIPFPDVAHMAEPKSAELPPEFFDNPLERPRDAAVQQFMDEELKRYFPGKGMNT